MSRDWEATLSSWAKPASQSEEDKRTRTERAITDALNALPDIRDRPINVYAKGSYANRTNVRQDSDVDVNVEYTGIFFYDLTGDLDGLTGDDVGIEPSTDSYGPADLKDDVERALVAAFGSGAVERGNKAISLQESSRQLAADVVPCFSYRRYFGRSGSSLRHHKGTKIFPDSSSPIINWPQQHYDNGVAKNQATGKRFKAMVRVLKNLENEMDKNGAAAQVASYLVECLAFNVPNEKFGHSLLKSDLQSVLAYIWNQTRTEEDCDEWVEVNWLKWLFRGSQSWTWREAHAFADSAWDYVGFD